MTALAVALVLCCAMVCGTVLALRGVGARDATDSQARKEIAALQAALAEQANESNAHIMQHDELRREVEALRASVALRSM